MILDMKFEETEKELDLQFEETGQTFEMKAEEVQEVHTGDIPFATKEIAGKVIIGENLLVENGVVSVDVANEASEDNTKPITSAAVAVQIGNIETILKTI